MADSIPDLEQLLADLNQNNFPPHIAALPVKEKIKKAFTAYERCNATQPWGVIPTVSKETMAAWRQSGVERGKISMLTRILLTNIWWGFFFGPFYYLVSSLGSNPGLWRKGLVLFGGLFLLSTVVHVLFTAVTGMLMPQALDFGIAAGIGYCVSVMATYDLYRLKVKKEIFWW